MDSLLTQGPIFIISLIFMLGIVVVIHELGHYLVGRWYGAAAESFSVGFGKPLIERRDSNGTRWRINRIPFGGFVAFVPDREALEAQPHPLKGLPFNEVGLGARSLVMLAGPVANFLLAIVLFSIIFLLSGEVRQAVSIGMVQPDSPAERAGLEVGDRFLTVNGDVVENTNSVRLPVIMSSATPVELGIERNGELIDLIVVPERQVRDNGLGQMVPQGTIGIGFALEPLPSKQHNPATAVMAGVAETGETIELSVNLIGRIVRGQEPLDQLSGPVGIGDVTRRVVNRTLGAEHLSIGQRLWAGTLFIVQLCALVSVGIGLFNLLPLPILDGGHLVFNAYEAIAGKAVPENVQEASLTVGLFLLIGMAAIITWGDIVETGVFNTANG
ncbi:MAG: M50 family metallopeptidase [Pseudomonadota bacterium]